MSAPTATNGITYSVKRENNSAGQIDNVINTSNGTTHSASYNFNQFGQPTTISNNFAGTGQPGITMSYDALGRQSGLNDPNAGNCTYQYNAFGELIQQITPNGTYNMQYDMLGRVTQKTDGANNTYNYQYETSQNGKGQLKKITGTNETTEFKYDAFSRLTEKKETVTADNKVFKSNFTYNKYGQVINQTYPSGFVTTNEYDNIGNLIRIKNGNTAIWQLGSMAAPGLINNYSYNNGNLNNSIVYDNNLNLSQLNYGNLLQQSYTIEPHSHNIIDRVFDNGNNNENFTYDEFDRLTDIKYYDIFNTLQPRASQTYFNNGNFNNKSDCGDYVYGNSNAPYQLTQIQNPVTNNISLNTLNVTYNTFRKVSQIVEADPNGNKQFDFVYGNDEQRLKMAYSVGGTTLYTRYYADGCDRQENANNTYKEWTYIYAPTGLCAVYYNNNGTKQLLYTATDNLGSPVMLIDQNNNIIEQYGFDAWGRRRNPADWNDYTNVTGGLLIRGYTMHEMLDEVGIINMNGRVYDPVLGRFLQPDNYVQAPDNLQSYNRYAYVWNNPLKYTDPTGNFTWNDGIALLMLAGGIVLAATGVATPVASGLIAGGGNHFFGTLNLVINQGMSWNQASNQVGIMFGVSITPNWGNNSSTQQQQQQIANLQYQAAQESEYDRMINSPSYQQEYQNNHIYASASGNPDLSLYSAQSSGGNIESIVRDIYSQPVGYKITGDQIAGLNSKLSLASNFVNSVERVNGGLKVDFSWAGRLAIKASPHSIPNGTVFKIQDVFMKDKLPALQITAPGAALFGDPFNVYLRGNTYSQYGYQFYPIFKK